MAGNAKSTKQNKLPQAQIIRLKVQCISSFSLICQFLCYI